MLTISEVPTTPISDMRNNSSDTTLPTSQDPRRTFVMDLQEDTTPSTPSSTPGWRAPFPQIARKSTPFHHLTDAQLAEKHRGAQDAATAAAIRQFNCDITVRDALANLKYLLFTKWTQTCNPIDDWEIQDSGNWTTPSDSTTTTPPSPSVTTISDDSMDIASTRSPSPEVAPRLRFINITAARPSSPVEEAPLRFTVDTPAKILVHKVVSITSEDSSDSDSDSEGEFLRARNMDAPNPFLRPDFVPVNSQHSAPHTETTWGTPPPSPKQGSDMQPPARDICGPSPGPEWIYNTPGGVEYFRFLIPNPETRRACVAPWLKYVFTPSHSTVSATYGAEYPIYKRSLRPTPVDYDTRTLTPQETRLFNTGEDFTTAVDFILQHCAPFDVISGIQHYRMYRDAANATQARIKAEQEKFMEQLERSMEVLSDLENADAFNRLINLKNTAQLETTPHFDSMQALNVYLDTLPERKHHPIVPERSSIPLMDRLTYPPVRRVPLRTIHASPRRCYKCGGMGHIRQQCPSPMTYTSRNERAGPVYRK